MPSVLFANICRLQLLTIIWQDSGSRMNKINYGVGGGGFVDNKLKDGVRGDMLVKKEDQE